MKILILSDGFLPENRAGAEQVSFRLAKKYKEAGHEVTVLTTTRKKEMIGESRYQGLRVIRFFCRFTSRWQAYRALYNPLIIRSLKEILKNNKFDIVQAHNIHLCFSYYSLRVIKKFAIPLVLTLHDCMAVCYKKFDCFYDRNDLDNPPRMDYKVHFLRCLRCQKKRYFPLRNILIRHFLNTYPDKVVAVSTELKKLLKTNRIRIDDVIYNGVDIDNFETSEQKVQDFKNRFFLAGKKIVLFGGRMTAAKGGGQVLKAMELVCKKDPRAWLVVLAEKDDIYSKFLVDQAKKAGINILITGWLEGEDLIVAFRCCDLVVTPSIYLDAFGLMNIEAMACKRPVITSCFSGGKEIVKDGVSGYVINPFDSNNFSTKITNILTNETLAKRMGDAGFAVLKEKFSLKNQVKEYITLFSGLRNNT